MLTQEQIRNEIRECASRIVYLSALLEDGKKGTKKKEARVPPIELTFIEVGKIIRWDGGQLVLGEKKKQSWLILKTIYESKNHYASISKLEVKVWKFKSTEKKPFMDKHILFNAVRKLFKAIENNFPCKIKKSKDSQTTQLKGLRIIGYRGNR
jgi:hypothetical protein